MFVLNGNSINIAQLTFVTKSRGKKLPSTKIREAISALNRPTTITTTITTSPRRYKAIDLRARLHAHNLEHYVRAVKLCRAAHHPWRYGRSHNRTREFTVPAAVHPRRRTHPAARKASQFGCKSSSILHFVIRPAPGENPARRCKRALRGAITQWRSSCALHKIIPTDVYLRKRVSNQRWRVGYSRLHLHVR